MPITDIKARQAKPADAHYRLPDGGGLHLEVRTTGVKVWRYRFEMEGRAAVFTIGRYPEVSITSAREQREWAREQVRKGINPTLARDMTRRQTMTEMVTTFRGVAEEWISSAQAEWTPGYLKQLEGIFAADVYPELGALPIKSITAADLLRMLRKIESRGASSIALLARQRCSSVFRYAVATLRADNDPTAALAGALKRKPVRHHPHITQDQIPALLAKIDAYGGYLGTKIALRLLMLTFVRTGELRQAPWDEFDLDGDRFGVGGPAWVIPKERMKMGRQHIVPLASQAVGLLRELRSLSGGQPLLFPNLRSPGQCMTKTTINRVLERIGMAGQLSGHGFRGTASTALHEMGYSSDWIELQLAHADKTVRGSYNHAAYLPERRKMMQGWADLIDRAARGHVGTLAGGIAV